MKTTKEVKLEQADVGVMLAADLKDVNGMHLLSAGIVLSQEILDKLKERGVISVCIEQEEVISVKDKEERRQQIEEKLSHIFRKVEDIPLMQDLKLVLLSHHCKEL